MRLEALLDGLEAVVTEGTGAVEVSGIALDSRLVRPGDLFFALPGATSDGRRHTREALTRGACAVVAAGPVEAPGATVVRTATPRRLLGLAAARLAGDPSRSLTLVGLTGTNGKTTTTYLPFSRWIPAGRSWSSCRWFRSRPRG